MGTLLETLIMIQMFELYRLKMCGQFAGQFSRDNYRFVYIQVTDLFCNFPFCVNRLIVTWSLEPASTEVERQCAKVVERSTCLLLLRRVRLKPVRTEDPFLGTKLDHHGIVTSNAATNAFIGISAKVRDE